MGIYNLVKEVCKNENEKLIHTEILIGVADYLSGEISLGGEIIDENYLIKTQSISNALEVAEENFDVIIIKTEKDYLVLDVLGE